MSFRRCCIFVLIAAVPFLLGACDSGDPIDNSPPQSMDVAGTYAFTELAVVPEATVLRPLNLLDTLVQSDTRLQLFSGGDFVLTYRYVGQPSSVLFGRYTVVNREVRLQASDSQSDTKNWRGLLMSDRLVLQRSTGADQHLSANFRKQVDMATLSDEYGGLPPLVAMVRIRLDMVSA